MKLKRISVVSFFLALFLILDTASFCRSADNLIGVAPEDEKYYKTSSGKIKCRDGSKDFAVSQLNDDFCDCPDGTDEPGTSACPTGKFYCRNAGHAPLSIYSSRINDGICDCCDGSDEYDSKVKCQNTCWEVGKVARERLKKKIATYEEGVTVRKREVEQAKAAFAKDEAELSKLKSEEKILKGLVQQLKERKELIEKAEEKERLQKEKEEKEKKEAEEANLKEPRDENDDSAKEEPTTDTNDDAIGTLENSPTSQDAVENPLNQMVEGVEDDISGRGTDTVGHVEENAAKEEETSQVSEGSSLDSGSKAEDPSQDTESLSREELGRIVGSRWTGRKTEHESGEGGAAKDTDRESYEETPDNPDDSEYAGYESETEYDHHNYDDDDDVPEDQMDVPEDHTEDVGEEHHDHSCSSYNYDSDGELDISDIESTSNPSWLEKIQQTVRKILLAVNIFQSPVDKSEAEYVRKEYDESSAKLSKLQSRISSLTQKLKHDFGPEKEFYSLHGQCFESTQNKYVYKVCPFKKATQEEGHSTTRLGNWEKFEESYRLMVFSGGDKCWNGPDRSLKVRLRCGLKFEVTDVDEPSRCEYAAALSTPAVCLEQKLKELREKFDVMKKELPQGHDEL